jgi:hypothetical protein
MKKQFLLLGMLLLPTLAIAATPDFNGSWVRNGAASDPAPNTMYWMTRTAPPAGPPAGARTAPPAGAGGGGRGGGGGGPRQLMTVHVEGKTMQVTESNVLDRAYTLDGSAHTIPTDTGIQKESVTATLQSDSLVIDTTEPYGGMPGNATLKVKQVWTISPDGKTLTITTTRDVPAKKLTYKQVYDRTETQPAAICSDGCMVPK